MSAGPLPGAAGGPGAGQRPAVFFDRDGTLIELVHHLTDPAQVRLLPGAAAAVRALSEAGYACVVVTNQSVIGRGMLSEAGLQAVHGALAAQLRAAGAALDGYYHCPVVPAQRDPTVVEHPDRKPGPGMLLRAAADLGLAIVHSHVVGDNVSDLLAGRNAGCASSLLVLTGHGRDQPREFADAVVADAWAASQHILG